ncbi:DoxX family protein [Hoyosella altamirensis]|uniref:Putative membrane protein n=1 Tax=Hoyosella altamirensis TaxID=616997 RepID=A0A839RNC3_9ACTN|nr:hypothetical protein [Hoyosella altamirensis]MBB3037887.1 putative membrane protein [Hoyosella altamirensis]
MSKRFEVVERSALPKTIARWILGLFLVSAGVAHLTWARTEFLAQVPVWLPLDGDFVVVASGLVEIALGATLIALRRKRVLVGWIVAGFFVAIFPGNINQFVTQTDAFGLDSDVARGVRLLFQPVLVLWALWCTDALKMLRKRASGTREE